MSATKEESFTFSCECGKTLRARLSIVGRKAKCKTCGRIITIPKPRETYAFGAQDGTGNGSKAGATTVDELCSICQTPIESDEPKIDCGRCSLPFHEECWRENLGCSAYGCPNVNALKRGPDILITNPPPLPPLEDGIPWEFVLLAASVFATILGTFMCGLPTIVVAVINGVYLAKTARQPNMAAVVTCFVVCGIGLLVDLVVSAQIYSQ